MPSDACSKSALHSGSPTAILHVFVISIEDKSYLCLILLSGTTMIEAGKEITNEMTRVNRDSKQQEPEDFSVAASL